MVLNYDIVVDLTPEFNKQLSPKFSVSLGDHGSREYMARILQSGEPYEIAENSLVSIVGKKPDGHIFAYDCTYSDEYVYFTIEEQMTPVSGIVACELVIIDTDGHKLGSANFTFWVEPCPVSDGEASESDLQMFQEILDAADDLADVREILDRAVPIAEQIGDIDKMLAAFPTESASGELIAFADGADGIPAKTLTLNLSPHQSGSGDPSPDNVRSISGCSGSVKVTRAGKNLLENRSAQTVTQSGVTFRQESDGIHLSGTSTGAIYYNLINRNASAPILKAGTYTMHPLAASLPSGVDLRVSDVETQTKTYYVKTSPVTFTYTEDTRIFSFLFVPSGVTFDDLVIVAQLQAGSVATDYEPYITPTEYDITIPTSAGTVYGGSLTINDDGTGQLVVKYKYLKVTAASDFAEIGSFSEGTNGNRCGFRVKGNPFVSGADLYCNIGKPDSSASGSTAYFIVNTCWLYGQASGSYFRYIFPKTVTDSAAAMQYLIDNGCEIAYGLKEPVTYTLTASQVTTLLGDNTVWMDADGSIDLAYRADTQMYIDNRFALLNANLAFIEGGMTASRAYSVGQYVLIGGQLYKVTASIASGATFTIGTNVTATTVGTELTALA